MAQLRVDEGNRGTPGSGDSRLPAHFLSRSRDFDLQNVQMTRLTDNGRVRGAAISSNGRYVVYSRGEWYEESLWLRQVPTRATCSFCRSELVSMA